MAGRVVIVLNPNSGRVRRRRRRLRRLAAAVPGAEVLETGQLDAVALRERAMAAELIVVIGGDGTLQAALTALLPSGARLPPLLVIPAGTTNMSAADLGARRGPAGALRALAQWRRGTGPAPLASARPALCVDVWGCAGADVRYGLFFGAGAIHRGVQYFQQRVRAAGVRGRLGPALTVARLLLALLRRREHPLLAPSRARIEVDGVGRDGDWMLILASTLDRLLFGARPYWGRERAPLHVTAVEHQARRLPGALISALRGRAGRRQSTGAGYLSHNGHRLTLDGIRDYVIDGECFEAARGVCVTVTAPLRFLAF